MLVAYGPGGRPIVAEETPLEQLQRWSHERALRCPNCRSIVHVRGGPEKRTQLHFAHQKGECAWSTEAESVRHARGKSVLAHWLSIQFPQAAITLEERLPEPNRVADVFVRHKYGAPWAVEFQCAPLDIHEWQHRHTAYRNARILDIWIIGNNRREKQEAFIEAVIAAAREVLFLDPLSVPPAAWLRWPVSHEILQSWPQGTAWRPSLEGWVGRLGYSATLHDQLHSIRLGERGSLIHPARAALEKRAQLLQTMASTLVADEFSLLSYLGQNVSEEAVHNVILPLLRAYLLDPDLLRRYNFGRGSPHQLLREEDTLRVQRAIDWLLSLAKKGYSATCLQELLQELPFVGPYAAFARYYEMLLELLYSTSS